MMIFCRSTAVQNCTAAHSIASELLGVYLHRNKTNRRVNQMHPTTYTAKAYSATSETSPLASTKIQRRDPTDRDVQIEILFCGICHSDLHSVRNEWRSE